MKQNDICLIIDICRKIARQGTSWVPSSVEIPELILDFRPYSYAFLGKGNPAILVNSKTFQLTTRTRALEREEGYCGPEWVVNRTLVLSENIAVEPSPFSSMLIIGIVTHETGHAYNIAAGLHNTESNAYLFEIEVLCNMYEHNLLNITDKDLTDYFLSRLPQYRIGLKTNAHLEDLLSTIAIKFEFKHEFKSNNLLNVPDVKGDLFATNKGAFFEPNREKYNKVFLPPNQNSENDIAFSNQLITKG